MNNDTNEIITSAIKIAHYDFTDKKGKVVQTSKIIFSLGDFGYYTITTPLANEYSIFTKFSVVLSVDNYNHFVIKSINK